MSLKYPKPKTIESVLTQIFLQFCTKYKLVPFSIAADYHGSLVWQVFWDDSLKRQVTLSALPGGSDSTVIEVATAAGNDDAFLTDNTGTWVWSTEKPTDLSQSPLNAIIRSIKPDLVKDVREGLDKAYESAQSVKLTDLNQKFLLPR